MRAWCMSADEIPHRLRFLSEGVQDSSLPSALPTDFVPQRIVSVDCPSPAQLGALAETFEGRVDLMIDHHEVGVPYANGWIVPEAAATGELIFCIAKELLQRGALLSIPTKAQAAMYAAIASDTGRFLYSNGTSETDL